MSESIDVLFWPSKLVGTGFFYGWSCDVRSACVVGVLPTDDHDLSSANERLKAETRRVGDGSTSFGALKVLGLCTAAGLHEADLTPASLLRMELRKTGPALLNSDAILIMYEPPNPRKLRFLSVQPLQLDVTMYNTSSTIHSSEHAKSKLEELARQTLANDWTRPKARPLELDNAIDLINLAHQTQRQLVGTSSSSRVPSVTERKQETAVPSRPIKLPSFILVTLASLLNWQILGSRNSLKDVSATAHQLDVRLQQAIAAPLQFRNAYEQDPQKRSISRAHYINFYNTLWLIANDVIIGSAVLAFLCENNEWIASGLIKVLKTYAIGGVQKTLLWLNDWPGGLKLNYELGKFFCDAFLWFTATWEEVVIDSILAKHLSDIVCLIGLSAGMGTTFCLALLSDLLGLATFHLYVFYVMATAVFSFHVKAMGSLYNLFRGKKYNVLRERIEPSEYDLDQLLVGAILFTLAAFLFPTVLAYYLAFAVSRCCVIAIHAALEAVLAFLNHFPLFAVMLRFKDPDRLPGGLRFDVKTDSLSGEATLIMKNNPIPLSAIFYEYWALWKSFSQHYSPVYILGKLLSGQFIHPIPRSRLSLVDRSTTTNTT